MALPPQKFREMVFQLLFSAESEPSLVKDTALMLMKELKVTKKAAFLASERVEKILEKQEEIDHKMASYLVDYTFDRVTKSEKTILRLGIYELFFDPEIPSLVAISEALRLAKKFGTPSSIQFVNGVLDRALKDLPPST